LKQTGVALRIVGDRMFFAGILALSLAVLTPLLLILIYIVRNGIAVVNWGFLTKLPVPVGEAGGGISNALVGTAILVVLAAALSVPLGIAAGVFLSEYRKGRLSYLVRLSAEVLQGIPSIVIGIIAYLWVVTHTGGFSALSGGIALGITLKLVPGSLKEASLALGVPHHRTIMRIILPAAAGGITTGVLLSVARVAGETAPLLFTAFGSPFMQLNIFKPVDSLPLLIFNYATSPYPEWHGLAWGASFVLVVFVLAMNFIAKAATARWKVKF
jgi:phosphate transport system permease protein